MLSKSKQLMTIALAAAAIAAGTFATTGEASARGLRHGFQGFHGYKWQGYRWHRPWHFSKFYGYQGYGCYFVHKPWGPVKVCPWY